MKKLLNIKERREHFLSVLCRKANWIGHILRRNRLLRDAIERQMTEVKGVDSRRTQILDDFKNRINES